VFLDNDVGHVWEVELVQALEVSEDAGPDTHLADASALGLFIDDAEESCTGEEPHFSILPSASRRYRKRAVDEM
jgi:hypothetical protein